MKCVVEESDLRPAWRAMLPPNIDDSLDAWFVDDWPTALIRIEADNGTFTMAGPYGRVTVPAEVERRGVVFFPIRHFIDDTRPRSEPAPLEFDANPEYFSIAGLHEMAENHPFVVFDDPATAPLTWEPPPPEEDDEFDDDE